MRKLLFVTALFSAYACDGTATLRNAQKKQNHQTSDGEIPSPMVEPTTGETVEDGDHSGEADALDRSSDSTEEPETVEPKTAYILLHGLNSDASTWERVVTDLFAGQCPVLNGTASDQQNATNHCYRYNFMARQDASGNTWDNGDGATFSQLGEEVKLLVDVVNNLSSPTSIVFVAHSRGGLAARSFLQNSVDKTKAESNLRFGLLTIGTPHRGTPVGLMKHWFILNGYGPADIKIKELKFAISPSTGYLAQSFGSDGQPVRNDQSEAIWKLEDSVRNLTKNVDTLGQIYSYGLDLGQDVAPGVDLFSDSALNPASILPGDHREMANFVLKDVPPAWRNGDNIVPAESAQISKIQAIADSNLPIFSNDLAQIVHADPIQFDLDVARSGNDGLTGQTGSIQKMLESMTDREGFSKFLVK